MQPSYAGHQGGQFYPREGVIISCALQLSAPADEARAPGSEPIRATTWIPKRTRRRSEFSQTRVNDLAHTARKMKKKSGGPAGCSPRTRAGRAAPAPRAATTRA